MKRSFDLPAERDAWTRQRPIVTAALLSIVLGPERVRRRSERQAAEAIETMPVPLRVQRAALVARNLGVSTPRPPEPEHLGDPAHLADAGRFGQVADEHVRREFRRRAEQGIGAIRRAPAAACVEGIEHLEGAVERGRGVVLWRMNLADPAPLNRAIADLGHPLVHLSASDHHVVADSMLSRHVWSKVSMRSEVRELGERVVFSPTDPGHGYLHTLKHRLSEGRVVSIVGDSRAGSRQIPVAVCGNRWFVPTGGPSLAHSCDAPLLTAHVLDDHAGASTVVIGPPIDADRSNRRAFRTEAAHQFAARIEAALSAAPETRLTLSTMRRRPVSDER